MRIAIFETEQWEHAACLGLAPTHKVTCHRERLDAAAAALAQDAEVVSAFVTSDLGAAVLDQLPRLRLIATRSMGYDHIDPGRCAARGGGAVANVPDYGDHTVAEHAFALLLAVSRRGRGRGRADPARRLLPDGLRGCDLHGRTLGVVGTSRIGRRAITIGR
jgi:D-lactate dehydrogenase